MEQQNKWRKWLQSNKYKNAPKSINEWKAETISYRCLDIKGV